MAGINQVTVVGNVGKDPEIRYLPDGAAVCNVSVATSETWKDKSTGERKENTEWHRIVMYGKTAEIAGEYVKKGSQIGVQGKLKTRKWQDQSGADRYTTEIVCDQLTLLGSRQSGGAQQDDGGFDQGKQQAPQQTPHQQAKQDGYQPQRSSPQSTDDLDDEIPF